MIALPPREEWCNFLLSWLLAVAITPTTWQPRSLEIGKRKNLFCWHLFSIFLSPVQCDVVSHVVSLCEYGCGNKSMGAFQCGSIIVVGFNYRSFCWPETTSETVKLPRCRQPPNFALVCIVRLRIRCLLCDYVRWFGKNSLLKGCTNIWKCANCCDCLSSKHEDVSPTNVQRAIRSVLNDSGLKQVALFFAQ